MDSARPLISVVIPCHNHAHFLAEAIESAGATEFPVEVVVIDDGSTDGSADVASRYPVNLIRQDNRGLAAARNQGLAECHGTFVVFLDADDRLLPGGLDTAARALCAHRSCAFAYGRCVMMGADGVFWPTPEQAVVRAGHYAAFLRTNPVWMPAMAIIRRAALQACGGFRQGFDAAADYDLYLRLSASNLVHDHGQRVAAYRRHDNSMSSSARRMLRETLTVMQLHRDVADDTGFLAMWREGYGAWRDFYGTQLVQEIRADVKSRRVGDAFGKSMDLARLAPNVFARELGRAARRRYADRAMPAAEI